jgi:GTPase SAR1 family protein
MSKKKRDEQRVEQQQLELPPGVKLLHTLEGRKGPVFGIEFDPSGRILASGNSDGTVKLWDVSNGHLLRTLERNGGYVLSVTFDPSGQILAAGNNNSDVRLWDASSGKLLRTLKGHRPNTQVLSVVFDLSGKTLASGNSDGTVKLWDVSNGHLLHTLGEYMGFGYIWSVRFNPSGEILASGSGDGIVRLWNVSSGKLFRTLEGHKNIVLSVAFDPLGEILAVGSNDKTVRLWNVSSGKLLRTLEGHTNRVGAITFSADGRLLVSKSDDGTLRLWSCKTWDTVAVIPEPTHTDLWMSDLTLLFPNYKGAIIPEPPYSDLWISGLAFHPTLSLLAAVGSKPNVQKYEWHRLIHLWELDSDVLLGKAPKVNLAVEAMHHTTAKIVLVGDSGVGKTGLGWRLAHGEYKEHSSTHGQQFWVIKELGTRRKDGTECEAILWDLAGQPDYRLTHALFLDDADLALVLFDPTDSRDPLHGVEFWLKQLKSGMASSSPAEETEGGERQKLCPTILVGGRADRGEARLTQEELDEFCRERGICGGYLATSAKDETGLKDLLRRMKEQIPWEQKSATVTTVTFKRIKDYVLGMKENRRIRKVIVSPQDLRKRLEKTDERWKFTDAEMMTAVRHLSNYGYVRVLKTSKGEERVLLVPELLNNLAASFVLEARRNQKGLGSLEEKRLLAGEYEFRELEKLTEEEQSILLDSAALLFLEHNVCFRETDLGTQSYLVFPELINLKKPLLVGDETEDSVAYTVSGAIENVYASLVVLLGYTQTFTRTNQWRNQARYEVGDGLICGFRQDDESEGELNLVLYFGTNVIKPVRTLFQGLFESFLARRNLSVFRYEPAVCSNGHVLNRVVVRDRMRDGSTYAFCAECADRVALPKAHEPIQLTQKEQRKVDEQRWLAEQRTRFEQAIFRLASYVEDQKLDRPECFISYAWGDRERERWVEQNLAKDLQKAGVNVVLDRWENDRAGKSVSRFVSRIAECDIVIPVGTPLYFEKFKNEVSSTGSVVAAEVALISQRLLGTDAEKETVMPLLLAGEKKTSLPPLMWDQVHRDFRTERAYFITAFDFILDLYEIAHHDTAVADLRESLREFEMRGGH